MVQGVSVVSNRANNFNPLNCVQNQGNASVVPLNKAVLKQNGFKDNNSQFELQTRIAEKVTDDAFAIGFASGILLDILKVKRPALKGLLIGTAFTILMFILYSIPQVYNKVVQDNNAKKNQINTENKGDTIKTKDLK